jgi:hypothetical protein
MRKARASAFQIKAIIEGVRLRLSREFTLHDPRHTCQTLSGSTKSRIPDVFKDILCNSSSIFGVFFRFLGKRHFLICNQADTKESCLVILLRGEFPYHDIRMETRHLSVRKQRFSFQKSLHCCELWSQDVMRTSYLWPRQRIGAKGFAAALSPSFGPVEINKKLHPSVLVEPKTSLCDHPLDLSLPASISLFVSPFFVLSGQTKPCIPAT